MKNDMTSVSDINICIILFLYFGVPGITLPDILIKVVYGSLWYTSYILSHKDHKIDFKHKRSQTAHFNIIIRNIT